MKTEEIIFKLGESADSGGIASAIRSINKKIMGKVINGLSNKQAFK